MDSISEIKSGLSIFKNLYDNIRIVDPIKKEVIYRNTDKVYDSGSKCFEAWNRNKMCENCISMRAYVNNDTFVKIEYEREKIILIIATTVKIKDNMFVIEFIKDITQNNSTILKESKKNLHVEEIISSINESYVKDKLTGAYSKNYIYERLPVDISYNKFNKLALTVIIAEIDAFENIKDDYGKEIGDKVLTYFSSIVQKTLCQSTNWLGRYDEAKFIIILNDTKLKDAYLVVRDIKENLEKNEFKYKNASINVSASFENYSFTDYTRGLSDILWEIHNYINKVNFKERNTDFHKLHNVNESSINYNQNNDFRLLKLNRQINELRETLGEICSTEDINESEPERLFISECLDELIVKYMKEADKDKKGL